jgi:hypothetical protein
MLALHLLATTLPKTAQDASRLYASPPSPDTSPRTPERNPRPPREAQPAIQYAHVIEVLKDRTPDLDFWLTPTSNDQVSHNLNPNSSGNFRDNSRKRTKINHKPNRSQRWAPFDFSPDGLTLMSAFGPEMAGAGGKPVSESGQTHIVKQFPFGRRV